MPGYYSPSAGQVITAANWNSYVRDQLVTVFANAAARASAITTPVEGMVTFLQDIDRLEVYIAGSWRPLPGQCVLSLTSATLNVLNLDNGRNLVWTYSWTPPAAGTYQITTRTPFDGVAGEESRGWLNVAGVDVATNMMRFPAGVQVIAFDLPARVNVASTAATTIKVDAQRINGGSFFNSRSGARILTIDYMGINGIPATG